MCRTVRSAPRFGYKCRHIWTGMSCPGLSCLALEEMQELWCGWWQRGGNISAIQSWNIDRVLCCAYEVYALISFSICQVLPSKNMVTFRQILSMSEDRGCRSLGLRALISCVHHLISSDLLIGCCFSLFRPLYLVPHPAGLKIGDLNGTCTATLIRAVLLQPLCK
jgi:hypothetical protein